MTFLRKLFGTLAAEGIKSQTQIVAKPMHDSKVASPTKIKPPTPSQELQQLFKEADLTILDIGGRGGPLSIFRAFSKHCNLITCDADKQEAVALQNSLTNENAWKSVEVIPHAIGNGERSQFFLTNQPGLSSLLEPNLLFIGKYFDVKNWTIGKTLPISPKRLDDVSDRRVDFIKLDTQGTELDILQTGIDRVLPNTLAVYSELIALPFYKGQYPLSEFFAFMEKNGFQIVDLKRTLVRREEAKHLKYSKRELSWFHALFVRSDWEALDTAAKQKLICLFISLEYLDSAYALAQNFESPRREIILKAIEKYSEDFDIKNSQSMTELMYRTNRQTYAKDRDLER